MDARFTHIAAIAALNHGVVSLEHCRRHGISSALLHGWVDAGLLHRLGPRSLTVAGTPPTWHRTLAAGLADLGGHGVIAGRAGARLLGLDGFVGDAKEYLLPRAHRSFRTNGTVCSTAQHVPKGSTVLIEGLRCLHAEELILDSPLFDFSVGDTERAIDSAIRLRLVSEQRLRTHVIARHTRGINGGRRLLDALVDTGGESRLERWFLRIVREAGLQRPELQRTFRDGSRTVARVDAFFAGNIVVELEGHGTHSSRQQRQRDEQRRTELLIRGYRVLTFTYLDVRDRPAWVIARLREALALAS